MHLSHIMTASEKISQLRKSMQDEGVDAVIVANTDPHNNEYVADPWLYRAWLSGFHGSNGTLVVTQDQAGLWTDSRYFLMAEAALEGSGIDLFRTGEEDVPELNDWLEDQLAAGQTVAFSGAETSLATARKRIEVFEKRELTVRTDLNLVERIWADRPALSAGKVDVADVQYVGLGFREKLAQVREEMAKKKLDAYLLGRTDETGWLFNLRGSDLENSTVVLAFTLVTLEEVQLLVDVEKFSPEQVEQLNAGGCRIRGYQEIEAALGELPEGTRLLVDKRYLNYALSRCLVHCEVVEDRSIVTDLKAIKNAVEVENLRECLVDDGMALVRFFCWLERELGQGTRITEWSASVKLQELRATIPGFRHVSFPSIMGYQANGALPHYTVTEDNDVEIKPEGILLLDSGGTYRNGTTDITRVVPLGAVTEQQQIDYTSVLKGLIRLSLATFPKNATCAQLDGICRSALWEHQRDFLHGTGHGIGYGLEVHEGPQGFGGRSSERMKPGMTTTIEPGLYRTGDYGIRIENIVLCVEQEESPFGYFNRFETLTVFPINTDLVKVDMLSEEELTWLNTYNAGSYEKLTDKVSDEERSWLERACRPIV